MLAPKIFVFPPDGPKYKFPKILPNCFNLEDIRAFQDWLIENEYPEDKARKLSFTESEYFVKFVEVKK